MKDIFDTDWNAELAGEDTGLRKQGSEEIQVVYLKALQRLARDAGMVSQKCDIQTPSETMVQAVFSCTFKRKDSSETVTFTGCGDCNSKNTSAPYLHFPTSVAEARAESRCLKKALGITLLTSEEIGFHESPVSNFESQPTKPIASSVVAAIEKLCESNGVEQAALLDKVVTERDSGSIFKLADLTQAEGQAAMKYLNSLKPKKQTAKEKRDARKEELTK